MMRAGWAALMLAATVGARPAPVRGVRSILLDEKAGSAFKIETARNVLTTVEFPEDLVGTPACGACSEGAGADGDALFRLETSAQGRYLTIRPSSAAMRRSGGEPVATTVLVRLEHKILTLYVELAEREQADTRVVFAYPNRAAESEYLRVERAKLEAEGQAKIEEEVNERFLQAFLDPHHCAKKSDRARHDDMVLRVTEVCYFGREVVVVFSLENRGRTPFEVRSVMVNKGSSKRGYLPDKRIEFDKVSSGVVTFRLPEGDNSAGPYEVTVYESAGKQRVVSLGGVSF